MFDVEPRAAAFWQSSLLRDFDAIALPCAGRAVDAPQWVP